MPPEFHSTRFLLDGAPFPEPFAIITAWNPLNTAASSDQNRAADEAMRQRLYLLGVPYFRATGCAPDRSHAEPGWAVPLPFEPSLELARDFRQLAFWWIERDELFLVPCENPGRERIDRFSSRVIRERSA